MPIKVEEYIREDASIPYKQWFDGLSSQAAAKVTVAKLRMELGNTSSIKWFDGITGGCCDLRSQARTMFALRPCFKATPAMDLPGWRHSTSTAALNSSL